MVDNKGTIFEFGKYKYYRISNNDVQNLEDLLDENKIEYKKYNDVLKAVCDEESYRLLNELSEKYEAEQKMSLSHEVMEHVEDFSNVLFNNDNDLLDYYYFQDTLDKYIERNELY